MAERKRAQTVSSTRRTTKSPKGKKPKGLTKIERHTILLKTVKDLGYDMSVFHLRWMPGEYLDRDTLESVPMFWFKKFGWIKPDVLKLYKAGQLDISTKRKRELRHVFGRGKKRSKKRDSSNVNNINASFFGSNAVTQATEESKVNKDDIYRRTRRLLKKVSAVPSKVRVIDNQSSLNINNAGFPDLEYVSSHELPMLNDENESDDNIDDTPNMNMLQGISENTEEILPVENMIVDAKIDIKSPKPHHRSTDSMTTPFGDMDTNTLINLRAKHRRTSSLMQRTSSEFSMKNYIEIVWNKLAVISGRGGDTLTQSQFDIELQNNKVLGDPDICKSLFLTIQNDNPINKKQINKNDFDRIAMELDKIPLIDEISRNMDNDKKIWIILKQVFVHIAQSESFDIAAYLSVKLTTDDLNNVDLILEYISSRHKEWTTRLRILKWITANLEDSLQLRDLTNDNNIGPFLLGWITQCLDERSNLSKAALEMFPNILSIAMTHTGEAFQYLNDIFSSLFLVLRNKRSKDLTETANECCIQCVDMIMDWHEHGELDNEVLLEICHIFRDNTNIKEQKHDKIRERCCAYFGYILFGIKGVENINENKQNDDDDFDDENQQKQETHMVTQSLMLPINADHILSKSADYINGSDNANWIPKPRASIVGHENALKISKNMKRIYLLDNKEVIEYMNDAMNNALNDKSADTRNTSFKLMEKLDKVNCDKEILGQVLKIDPFGMSKYNKWKERKNKKGRKKIKKKKSNRQRIKPHSHDKKQSVTLTIGAQ
eukprot:295041_1